ncbi:MAG: alkaline shock response membrane anchor protein AmaP [Candidatus Omnitrophota bacterium]
MKITLRLAVLFYNVVALLFACLIGAVALNLMTPQEIVSILEALNASYEARMVLAGVALGVVAVSYLFSKAVYSSEEKGRNIAFDNPSGRVSVSLNAIEDLIRRVVSRQPEVKDVRAAITAGKKGLDVAARLSLTGDVNIPEMTSRIQHMIKRKIQDIIGIEETVVVRVDIAKINPSDGRGKQSKQPPKAQTEEPNVPFQGYRA